MHFSNARTKSPHRGGHAYASRTLPNTPERAQHPLPPASPPSSVSSASSGRVFSTPSGSSASSMSDVHRDRKTAGPNEADLRSPTAWQAPDEWGVVPDIPDGETPVFAHDDVPPTAAPAFQDLAEQLATPYDYAGINVEDILRGGGEEYHRSLDDEEEEDQSLAGATALGPGDGAAGPWGYEPSQEWGGTREVYKDLAAHAPPRLPPPAAASTTSVSSRASSTKRGRGATSSSGHSRPPTPGSAGLSRSASTKSRRGLRRKSTPTQAGAPPELPPREGGSSPVPQPQTQPQQQPRTPVRPPRPLPPTPAPPAPEEATAAGGRRRSFVSRLVRPTSSSALSQRSHSPPVWGRRKASLPSPAHMHTPTQPIPLELALNSMLRPAAAETYVSSPPRTGAVGRSASAGMFSVLTAGRRGSRTGSSPGIGSDQTLAGSAGSGASAATVTLGHGVARSTPAVGLEREVMNREAAETGERESRVRRWRRGLSLRESGRV